MLKQNSKKKVSIEEALESRTESTKNPIPEKPYNVQTADLSDYPEDMPENPTHDEIVEKALAEAQLAESIQSQEPPQVEPSPSSVRERLEKEFQVGDALSPSMKSSEPTETLPVQPETVTSNEGVSSPPEKEKRMIPVQNIDRLHATETSIQESPEAPINPIDPNLQKLIDYVHSGEYSKAWIVLHITSISSYPRVMPSPPLWDVPNNIDIAELIYKLVLMPGFVENCWPYLRLILGSSRDNVSWAAAVLTTISLFEVIKTLPYHTQEGTEK